MTFGLVKAARLLHRYVFCPTPLMLVYFVTDRCNAHCRMCFRTSSARSDPELTVAEVEKISSSLGVVQWLLLSGGEPFLRPDLVELCSAFLQNSAVRYLQIPTNGWNAERITTATRSILEANPQLSKLVVAVSIDHIGHRHDEIRGVPGLYENACETTRALDQLAKRKRGLTVTANVTYSAYNHQDIFEIYDTIKATLPVESVSLTLTRGSPREPGAKDYSVENYLKLVDRIGREDVPSLYTNRVLSALGKGRHYYKNLSTRRSLQGNHTLNCQAGRQVAVLSETGEVYGCELKNESLGNIRDYGYDFRKMWRSPKVRAFRRAITKMKCHCTYECVMGPNIFCSFRFLVAALIRGFLIR